MPTIPAPLDPDHIPPPPRRPGGAQPRPDRGPTMRITIAGLGPLQEACLVGMVALALSWGSVELLFSLGQASPEPEQAILSAALQP